MGKMNRRLHNKEVETWIIDQITKSKFFHSKLHKWELLEIAYELESIKGEELNWNKEELGISSKAWDKIIHRGIKPVKVFSHPEVLIENPKRVRYYRMLAMVSQKSMTKIGLSVNEYEERLKELDFNNALKISKHLNKIISILIEEDKELDEKEFDLWRGMAAGAQAQGAWQNTKGDIAEVIIKDLIIKRIKEGDLVFKERKKGRNRIFILKDGRELLMGSEPDIAIYKNKVIQVAIEIKGGIDPAGVLERFGAALKSLKRAKESNADSITILIIQGVSLTPKAKREISESKEVINYFFILEELINEKDKQEILFKLLSI